MDYLYGKLKTESPVKEPESPGERLLAASRPVLSWYREYRRVLPWRENPSPYRVWISEIMLQQTRVEAVKPYFARFMEALPDIRSLSQVEEERLLKLWEGLGYYNRARNLKKAAQRMMERHGGRMPDSYEEILSLPGIGSYTAGAIGSIAFGLAKPAVDGNVLRVMARLFADRGDIKKAAVKKRYEALIEENMDKSCPGEYNQALIELGALLCLPSGRPACEDCPAARLCLAKREGLVMELPVRAAQKPRRREERTVFVIQWEDRTAVRKRSARGLLASMYEFPNVEGYVDERSIAPALGLEEADVAKTERLPDAVHIFSHVEWHMAGYRVKLVKERPELFTMIKNEEIHEKYPLPNAFGVYTKALM